MPLVPPKQIKLTAKGDIVARDVNKTVRATSASIKAASLSILRSVML